MRWSPPVSLQPWVMLRSASFQISWRGEKWRFRGAVVLLDLEEAHPAVPAQTCLASHTPTAISITASPPWDQAYISSACSSGLMLFPSLPVPQHYEQACLCARVCVCVCLCVSFYVWISCWSNSTSHHSAMTASSHRASPAWVRPAVTVNSPWKHFNSLPHITNMELKSGQWMGNRGNPFLTPQIRFTTEAWTILLFRCASYIYLYPIVTVWFLWPQAVSYVIS